MLVHLQDEEGLKAACLLDRHGNIELACLLGDPYPQDPVT